MLISRALSRLWPAIVLVACGQGFLRPALLPHQELPTRAPGDTLKVHMNSGHLYVLDTWSVDTTTRQVAGAGMHYDLARNGIGDTAIVVPLDSVAVFETNTRDAAYAFGLQGIAVFTGLGVYISAVCLADPKSCFGSCPTFYIEGDEPDRVQAEGFSASVARALEARDVDALPRANAKGRRLRLHMRNEALETHAVRAVSLLVAPRPANGRVFAADDTTFYAASNLTAPIACTSAEGECLKAIAQLDGVERSSASDSLDLAAREQIELTFASVPQNAGLVLTGRNSLVTTFLFYQTLAYLGSNAGALLASMERGGRSHAASHFGMARLLGPIEVQIRDGSDWRTVGSFGEPGPIAADTKVIPLRGLPPSDSPVHVRLRLAKGNWRIDRASLATLGAPVTPARVLPTSVERNGQADVRALAALHRNGERLVSLPGDDYRIVFDLPHPAESLEIFLESEGYYYEWMRREWLAEENPMMAALVVFNPAQALRQLAPAYKSGESRMEQLFWESRFHRTEKGSRESRP
ncbi:MAG: hypothetical protein WD825_11735 [Gemmatimonadaceae bacterium]